MTILEAKKNANMAKFRTFGTKHRITSNTDSSEVELKTSSENYLITNVGITIINDAGEVYDQRNGIPFDQYHLQIHNTTYGDYFIKPISLSNFIQIVNSPKFEGFVFNGKSNINMVTVTGSAIPISTVTGNTNVFNQETSVYDTVNKYPVNVIIDFFGYLINEQ